MVLLKEEKQRLDDRLVDSRQKFGARSVTITGKLVVEVPGRRPYTGVDRVEISPGYAPRLEVSVSGTQEKEGEGIRIGSGTVSATGYRGNPAEQALYSSKEVGITKDPHGIISQGGKEIVLNQIQGDLVVRVSDGHVSYTK